jgi:hypothetical protein
VGRYLFLLIYQDWSLDRLPKALFWFLDLAGYLDFVFISLVHLGWEINFDVIFVWFVFLGRWLISIGFRCSFGLSSKKKKGKGVEMGAFGNYGYWLLSVSSCCSLPGGRICIVVLHIVGGQCIIFYSFSSRERERGGGGEKPYVWP